MKTLLATMDTLLRDRESLYLQASEGRDLGKLFARLMAIFVLTAAIYGAGMGAFRWFHPEFVFNDFEIESSTTQQISRGRVAGMNPQTRTVFFERTKANTNLPLSGKIRFNVSQPSESAEIVSIGTEKDFGAITLPATMSLEETDPWRIPLFVMLKTPALFVLTLLLCAPALYVLNLVFDLRLHFMPVMTLMAFALAATGTILAVFVPIAGLFSVVTENYHFMKIFHLSIFAIAGFFGVKVLAEGLLKLAPEGKRIRPLMASWLMLYCLVGSQIAWTLKPFLGTPYLPATPPFRVEAGNIYVSAFNSFKEMGK
jgi:hypothetical protein